MHLTYLIYTFNSQVDIDLWFDSVDLCQVEGTKSLNSIDGPSLHYYSIALI